MAAVSITAYRGWSSSGNLGGGGFQLKDYTFGTAAPTSSFDFELRYNTTDANSKNVTKEDVIIFLKGLQRMLEQVNQSPAGTPLVTAPPL
jgi:hypothetical protein